MLVDASLLSAGTRCFFEDEIWAQVEAMLLGQKGEEEEPEEGIECEGLACLRCGVGGEILPGLRKFSLCLLEVGDEL